MDGWRLEGKPFLSGLKGAISPGTESLPDVVIVHSGHFPRRQLSQPVHPPILRAVIHF